MLIVRCKSCNKELISSTKTQVCGCPNKMEIRDDKVSAVNLSQVVITSGVLRVKKEKKILSEQDLAFQEARKARKVRKLDFEIR
jgi:hypothetical protein